MSDSVAGERLGHLRAAGLTLIDQLAPDDESALVTFRHVVTIDAPLTVDRARLRAALQRADGFGRTALIDATHTAMVIGESGVGRPLLIVFSDGVDTSSWLPPESVLEMADLVSYTPRWVLTRGWHRLDVRVKGRQAVVQARLGYYAGK